jgi:hypothetical protein
MKKYYFTFGCGIDDNHRNCYTVIEAADYESAREEMFRRFGNKWAFQYDEKDWFIDPKTEENWLIKCRMHGIDPNRTEPISQAELYNLTEI